MVDILAGQLVSICDAFQRWPWIELTVMSIEISNSANVRHENFKNSPEFVNVLAALVFVRSLMVHTTVLTEKDLGFYVVNLMGCHCSVLLYPKAITVIIPNNSKDHGRKW